MLVNRPGTAPGPHGLKGQRITCLLAVRSGPAFGELGLKLGVALGRTLEDRMTLHRETMDTCREDPARITKVMLFSTEMTKSYVGSEFESHGVLHDCW